MFSCKLFLGLRTRWTQKGSRRLSFDRSLEGGGTAVCAAAFLDWQFQWDISFNRLLGNSWPNLNDSNCRPT